MLSRIDHIGIAVEDLDRAIDVYERRLGLRVSRRERLDAEGIEVAMLPVGESRIELLAPTSADSTVRKFLDNRGEALHHVAYGTDDVSRALALAAVDGGQLIDEIPRAGAHGTRVGFLHPKSACGVLTEFVESRSQDQSEAAS
jgi:methylmalonyl-CoA/ethylmalonyl-CoA epimerase